MELIYCFLDIEVDGPTPGENSMLSLGIAAFDEDEREVGEFETNLETLEGARGAEDVMRWWRTQPEAWAYTLNTVRILDAGAVLATHPRSFDRGQQIEDPAHIEELERHKRLAREHRATDRLHHAAPSAKALFVAAAQRNHHLGVLARGLIELLNAHGPVALERAIAAALDADAAYLGGVRHRASSRSERHHRPAAQRIRQAPTARACPARRPAAAHPLGAPPRPRRLRPPERRIRLRR